MRTLSPREMYVAERGVPASIAPAKYRNGAPIVAAGDGAEEDGTTAPLAVTVVVAATTTMTPTGQVAVAVIARCMIVHHLVVMTTTTAVGDRQPLLDDEELYAGVGNVVVGVEATDHEEIARRAVVDEMRRRLWWCMR